MATGDCIRLTCSKCGKLKSLNAFGRRYDRTEYARRKGRRSQCLVCEQEYRKSTHARKLQNARMKKFRMNLKHSDYPEYRRRERQQNFRRNYGIEIEDYERMAAEQDNKCAICGGPPVGCRWERDIYTGEKRVQRFSVDHCHKTGKVRALLCGRCNRGLGDFMDNPELLKKAAKYLKRHSTVTVPVS